MLRLQVDHVNFGNASKFYAVNGRDVEIPANWLLVAKSKNGKVLGVFGEEGRAVGQLGIPHGTAVGAGEEIYVAELLTWRAQKFEIK